LIGRSGSVSECSGSYPSGQRGQTVNLLASVFGGSNPPLPTCGFRRKWTLVVFGDGAARGKQESNGMRV
jgi:hypothetical protein